MVSEAPGSVVALANRTQRRAARPNASVWVTASAGSGKTKVLTDRLINLLLAGTRPERILCLTFTKAAAAEMNLRVNDRLGEWATLESARLADRLATILGRPPVDAEMSLARQLFARVLEVHGGMKLMTIHAFCQSVLRRFPLEAGIAPHFEVMDERDAAEALARAQAEMLAAARAGDTGLADAVAEVTSHIHETAFPALINAITASRGQLARWSQDQDGFDGLIARVWRVLGVPPGATAEAVVGAACADAAVDATALRQAAGALSNGSDNDRERGRCIADWLAAPSDRRAASFDLYADVFLTKKREPRAAGGLHTKKAVAAMPALPDIMAAEQRRLLDTVEQRRKATVGCASAALIRLADALLQSYATDKAARALLDYDDLILHTRDLLARAGVAAWVLFKLDGGLDHILIDEGQDTNPEQWEIVAALAEEFFVGLTAGDQMRPLPRTVFAVGDTKQSIFSFQRADPAAFEAMRRHFRQRVDDSRHAWDDVPMFVSFRSTSVVLHAIDAVFAREAAQAGVVGAGGVVRHLSSRDGDGGCVEIWPPLTPQSPPAPEPWKPPVDRVTTDDPRARLAALIARRIRAWLDSGEQLASQGRPITPGDIMVLVRRRGGFVEALVRALKDRDVAVAGVDRMELGEQLAVMDLVALGAFLLLPEDDLTLATVLKSPLVGLGETELFDLAHGRSGSLWRALGDKRRDGDVFDRAWRYLSALLARTDYDRPFELFAEILNGGGRRKLLARLGPDAEDAIDEFLSLALQYERINAPSLQGFIHWLAAGKTEIKRDLDHGSGAVRVMTVHGAKGLQAPIVFLPDTMQLPPADRSPLLWPHGSSTVLWAPRSADRDAVCAAAHQAAKQAQLEEYRRLLYVAMTRAADRLYVCGWRTRTTIAGPSWYDLIRDGLIDIAEETDEPFLAAAAEAESATVLRLATPQARTPPARREPAVVAPVALPTWARTQPANEPEPPRPLAPSQPDRAEPTVRSPLDGRFHRGQLIHRLLQLLPDLPDAQRAAACRRFLARPLHGLGPEQQAEIADNVLAVLGEPSFAAIFGPGSRAEVAIAGMLETGAPAAPVAPARRVVAGQVDRLVVTDESVWIVDYKSHRQPPASAANAVGAAGAGGVPVAYLRQMAAYQALMQQIYPTKSIQCALLWTEVPVLMRLDAQALAAHSPIATGALDAPLAAT